MNPTILRVIRLQHISGLVPLAFVAALVALFAPQVAVAADTEISSSVGPQSWTGDDFLITDTGEVDGGGANAIEVMAPGGGTLTNRGAITAPAYNGINTVGGFGSIVNRGTITDTLSGIYIINPDGGAITNEAGGIISGSGVGLSYAGSQLSVVTNAGLISGSSFAVGSTSLSIDGVYIDYGTIGTLNNSGTISSSNWGIFSPGRIETLNNSGTISGGSNAGEAGIFISKFGTLINDVGGTISGYNALHNVSFDTIINRGNITGIFEGLNVASFGTSDLIQNDGLISGDVAVDVSPTRVGTLINNGTIRSDNIALAAGPLGVGTFVNDGLIRGEINLSGSGDFGGDVNNPVVAPTVAFDSFVNSGTIEGDILAENGATLTINGGVGKRGVLTGLGGAQGVINTNFGAPSFYVALNAIDQDVTFGSGLLLLNDTILARNGNVRFAGANVQVNNEVAITSRVVLSAGDMVFGVTSPTTYGHYVVTGDADLDAGRVSLVALGAPSFAIGQSYHVLSADNVSAGSVTTSITGFNTSYDIVDMGGSYDFVVSIDGIDQSYNRLGLSAQQVALNSISPVIDAVALHKPDGVASLGSGMAAGSPASSSALWGKVLVADSSLDTSAGTAGYDGNSSGVIVGYDMPVSGGINAGLALSWLNSSGDADDQINGTDVDLDAYALTAYGAWAATDRWQFSGQISYGLTRLDQRRGVSAVSAVATSDYDGDQITGEMRGGYTLPLSATTSLTPYAALRGAYVALDSYSEQGAGAFNLEVDSSSAAEIRHDIGVMLATSFDTGDVKLTPALRVGWLHDYKDTPLSVSGISGSVGFVSTSDRMASDGLGVGVTADLVANDSVTVGVEYGGEFRSDYVSNTGALKLAIRF
ncbi:MAG: autotransporter domain-containing protein [Parvibaculum sp.]